MPKEILIDSEFQSLIPPLSTDEHERLEKSILEEGCRDALILWGNTLVDGHNRYEICTRHEIPFETVQRYFASRDDAKLWMMQNQLARRNLGDMQRVAIVRKCEDAVRAKAKERQGTRTDVSDILEKFPESTSRDELGAMAGVSGKTYEHAVTVLETAPASVVDAAMCNYMCAHDTTLTIKREDSQHIRYLDSQKEYGDKVIFGSGYLLSEKAAAEKAAAHVWELSEREWQIIKSLSHE